MGDVRDYLGEALIEKGFAPNGFVLDLNHSLTVPYEMELPAPWNLPSRLFRFPIEVCEATKDRPRRIGLMHPLLGEHPFVQRVAAELGIELDPNGAPNAYGVSKQRTGLWWHAVDLVSAGMWRELLETRRFTTDDDIAGAVCYGMDYSPHDSERDGHISTAEAREIMAAIGAEEPEDRTALLLDMADPRPCEQEKGQVRWPINSGYDTDAETRAWGRIFGIESGWFARDRGGFLQWTQTGRDRFAAGDSATYTEAGGQSAFAF